MVDTVMGSVFLDALPVSRKSSDLTNARNGDVVPQSLVHNSDWANTLPLVPPTEAHTGE